MKNRKWILIVSLLLAMSLSLGGTLAYLTDTDSDVNVMTLGNVDIEQLENGVADDGFDQGQPLYPAYYTGEPDINTAGAIEKRIDVKNVGRNDAYIRTVFAFEAGTLDKEEFAENIRLLWSDEMDAANLEWAEKKIEISDNQYLMAWYTYPEAIAVDAKAGETLQGVVMDKNADNTVMTRLGDSEYIIRVVSQAVQADNFDALYAAEGAAGVLDEAFGKLSAESHPWMDLNDKTDAEGDQEPDDVALVANDDELIAAIEKGATRIKLIGDITLDDPEKFMFTDSSGGSLYLRDKDLTLDLNGHAITVPDDALMDNKTYANGAAIVHYTTLNIEGEGTIKTENQSICVYGWAHSTININGGTYMSNASDRNESAIYVNNDSVTMHVYGGDFTNCDYAFNVHDKCTLPVMTLHEGVEFKQFLKSGTTDVFMSDFNAGRIVLAEGCKLETSEIDGVVWYKVVKE